MDVLTAVSWAEVPAANESDAFSTSSALDTLKRFDVYNKASWKIGVSWTWDVQAYSIRLLTFLTLKSEKWT